MRRDAGCLTFPSPWKKVVNHHPIRLLYSDSCVGLRGGGFDHVVIDCDRMAKYVLKPLNPKGGERETTHAVKRPSKGRQRPAYVLSDGPFPRRHLAADAATLAFPFDLFAERELLHQWINVRVVC